MTQVLSYMWSTPPPPSSRTISKVFKSSWTSILNRNLNFLLFLFLFYLVLLLAVTFLTFSTCACLFNSNFRKVQRVTKQRRLRISFWNWHFSHNHLFFTRFNQEVGMGSHSERFWLFLEKKSFRTIGMHYASKTDYKWDHQRDSSEKSLIFLKDPRTILATDVSVPPTMRKNIQCYIENNIPFYSRIFL